MSKRGCKTTSFFMDYLFTIFYSVQEINYKTAKIKNDIYIKMISYKPINNHKLIFNK